MTPYAPASKERFPIAVGVAFLDSRQFQTILVKPPDSWGLIKIESEQERKERQKKKEKKRVQVLAKITDEELFGAGKSPEEAAEIILSLAINQTIYSLDGKHDTAMLNKLSPQVVSKLNFLSTTALSYDLTSPERARNLQLKHKLRIGLYPRNKADIRWVVPWIDQCKN